MAATYQPGEMGLVVRFGWIPVMLPPWCGEEGDTFLSKKSRQGT